MADTPGDAVKHVIRSPDFSKTNATTLTAYANELLAVAKAAGQDKTKPEVPFKHNDQACTCHPNGGG